MMEMAFNRLVMVVQSNFCNRDFVIDHNVSMGKDLESFHANVTHLIFVS